MGDQRGWNMYFDVSDPTHQILVGRYDTNAADVTVIGDVTSAAGQALAFVVGDPSVQILRVNR